MVTESPEIETLKLNTEISSSTASSLYIKWAWEGLGPAYVRGFRVYYHRLYSTYVQHSGFLPPTTNSYGIGNLVADTYYKICVTMYCNDTTAPVKECVDGSTTSWHIPVSIGSSIGAVLALSIIVFIVLLSRCPNLVRQPRTAAAESSKYDSMSSHFPDDRYEMSDTTTHCQDHEDCVLSEHSETDSAGDVKVACRHNHHHHHHNSPQSLADRLCNGSRIVNGVNKHTRPVPLGRVGRTLSLTDRRNPHRSRQARLAHLHANFHSIQSEPGSFNTRPAPRISITDSPTSAVSADFSPARRTQRSCTTPPSMSSSKEASVQTSHKSSGFKENPRVMYTIESAASTSEPSMVDTKGFESKIKPPALKNISKTIHMSIDCDTLI